MWINGVIFAQKDMIVDCYLACWKHAWLWVKPNLTLNPALTFHLKNHQIWFD